MRKIINTILLIILVASLVGTGFFFYKKNQNPDEVYETVEPFYTDIVKKTVATGTITPRKEVDLKTQVSGVVDEIYVEAGDRVKNGQKVAKIKIIPNVVALNNAEMRVKSSVINFKNAQKELERQQKLLDENVISEADYNEYLLEFNLARQEMEAAENNLELVKEGASKKAGTASNIVTATSEGMILDVPVKEGTFVIETNTFNEGTTIASLAKMDELIFEGYVDESEVGKIKEGMDLNLKIGALDTVRIGAELEFISPKGIEEEGAIQFEIRAAITKTNGVFLRAGYSANADIVLDQRDSVLAINERDLIVEEDKKYVEVEKGAQQFEKREIKTGLSDGINIEILEGLKPDEKIKKL